MENLPRIATTVRQFSCLKCCALRLDPHRVLRLGMKVKIVRESSGITGLGHHESVHEITSIEVNHEKRQQVTREDGLCAIKVSGVVPPNGCDVLLIHDGAQHQEV